MNAIPIESTRRRCEIIQFPGCKVLEESKKEEKKSNRKAESKSSEVFPFKTEDANRLINYFREKEEWLSYLLFVLSCNMARRIGDMMGLTWDRFFDPKTGELREKLLTIREDKTDKLANPRINVACKDAIELYIEKTGCDPSKDSYSVPICFQLSGKHKGKIMSYSGYYKALKRAATAIGIKYNVGTHSPRKTFGMLNRILHPNDADSLVILQKIYNHSDLKTTTLYIGLTEEKVNAYYDDIGIAFNRYIVKGEENIDISTSPILSIEKTVLREIIQLAYETEKNDSAEGYFEDLSTFLDMAEASAK